MFLKLTKPAAAVLLIALLACFPAVAEQVGAATVPAEQDPAAVLESERAASQAPPGLGRVKFPAGSGLGGSVISPNPMTVILGLLAIVGFLFALAWLVRRFSPSALVGGQSMKILGGLSVGPREKIVLVDVGGQKLLLGVAPGRVNFLKDIPNGLAASDASGDFSSKLKQIMKSNKAGSEPSPGSNSTQSSSDRGVEP